MELRFNWGKMRIWEWKILKLTHSQIAWNQLFSKKKEILWASFHKTQMSKSKYAVLVKTLGPLHA